MTWLRTRLLMLCRGERGATAAEYCLLVSLVAGVIIGVVITFGTEVSALFAKVPVPFP